MFFKQFLTIRGQRVTTGHLVYGKVRVKQVQMKESSGSRYIQNERWEINIAHPTYYVLAYLILLHFVLLHFSDIAFFFKLKICVNVAFTKPINTICPTAFSSFMSLCHILVIQYFKYFYYYYIVMVIWDQCSFILLIVSVLGTTDHAHITW